MSRTVKYVFEPLTKLDILKLALTGAQTERGAAQGLDDEEWAYLNWQVETIELKIKRLEAKQAASGTEEKE